MKNKNYDSLINILSSVILITIIIMLSKFLFKEQIAFMNVAILWLILIGKKSESK